MKKEVAFRFLSMVREVTITKSRKSLFFKFKIDNLNFKFFLVKINKIN